MLVQEGPRLPHELWVGDCVDLMRQRIPSGSVDVVVTSPPYNLQVRYSTYADHRPRHEYLEWLRGVFAEIRRVLATGGSFFLNVAGTGTDPWIPLDVASVARDVFVLQNHIVWVKSIAIGRDTYGHFKPVNSKRFLNHSYEHLFHLTSDGRVPLDRLAIGVPYVDKTNIARWSRPGDLRCRGNAWFVPYDTIRDRAARGGHPATFPVELPTWCCRLHGLREDMLVVDPFVGHGTTVIAAYRLGISAIGIDVDPAYIEFARRWLADEQNTLFPSEALQTHFRPRDDGEGPPDKRGRCH